MGDASGPRHLPTRCPACKGAVIQRMPNQNRGPSTWFCCLFCNHIWKTRVADARANPNGELTGEVFIVATGTKYRFGSVRVEAIPEEALKNHLESRAQKGEFESQKLQREIETVTVTLKRAQAEEDLLWKIQKRDESDLRKAKAWSAGYNKTKIIARRIEDLEARRQQLASGEYFYRGRPAAISHAKTDADGQFTLEIPCGGRYGIVARASREVDDEKTMHFWFVWASLDGQTSKHLLLSNDNMIGAGSPDSALR